MKVMAFLGSALVLSNIGLAADAFDPKGGQHIAVYRPSNGTWYAYNRTTGAVRTQQWGAAGDIPVPFDYDDDGTTDFAVWRPSNGGWYIIKSSDGSTHAWFWGQKGDIPVPGNYHNSTAEIAVWRPSNGTWYTYNLKSTATESRQWGAPGDKPVPGSYATGGSPLLFALPAYAVWRPSNATWYVWDVYGKARPTQQWGANGDIPVAGDYNNDSVTDFAVFRPSNGTWYVIKSNFWKAPTAGTAVAQQWGQSGDIPIVNDYDGDGKADFTVWRPSDGTWYTIKSSTGTWQGWQWGQSGDVPVSYRVSPPKVIVK